MPIEIERKYLVDFQKWALVEKPQPVLYVQGYLLATSQKTIRIRLAEHEAFLTIKGEKKGFSCVEFEYPIPFDDAKLLLEQFCEIKIEKKRYKIYSENHLWEVDEFLGANEGLLLAEIELNSEGELFKFPEWIKKEVTGEIEYYSSSLAKNPFKTWKIK